MMFLSVSMGGFLLLLRICWSHGERNIPYYRSATRSLATRVRKRDNVEHSTKAFNDDEYPTWNLFRIAASQNFIRAGSKLLKIVEPFQKGRPCIVAGASLFLLQQYQQSREQESEKTKMVTTNPIMRSVIFWWRAFPAIAHYKFVKFWVFTVNSHYTLEERDIIWNKLHEKYAPVAYEIMEDFRGLFGKFGQMLSSRPDFMPLQYVELFTGLQDSLPPLPYEDIKEMIDFALRKKFDGSLMFEDLFESFDPIPLGVASIGQVHRAVLCPTSDNQSSPLDVAVKVMHPKARNQFYNDFKILKCLFRIALPGWTTALDELKHQLAQEFNYLDEANALEIAGEVLSQSKFKGRVVVPKPVMSLCMENVLIMEMLHGKTLSDHLLNELTLALDGNAILAKEIIRMKREDLLMGPIRERENKLKSETSTSSKVSKTMLGDNIVNDIKLIIEKQEGSIENFKSMKALNSLNYQIRLIYKLWSLNRQLSKTLDLLMEVTGYQIFSPGSIFNSDPHPGNIYILDDGRLGLIDWGNSKILTCEERVKLAEVVVALGMAEDNPDIDNVNMQTVRNSVPPPITKNVQSIADIANAMRRYGFTTLKNDDNILSHYAALWFDTHEHHRKIGIPDPQEFTQILTGIDPIQCTPGSAVAVGKASVLYRGLGSLLQKDVRTSKTWYKYAKNVLLEREKE